MVDVDSTKSDSIDVTSETEIEFNILELGMAVVLYNISGFEVSVTPNNFEIYQNSNDMIYIDFGNETGSIFLEKIFPNIEQLYYSSIIFPSFCTGFRGANIGTNHVFSIQPEGSKDTNSITYTNNMKVCIWFASPFNEPYSIEYKTEKDFDSFYLIYNNNQDHYSGIGNLTINTANLLLNWATDISVVSEGIQINSSSPSSGFSHQNVYYLAQTKPQCLKLLDEKYFYVCIQNQQYFEYLTSEFIGFCFLFAYEDSSLAIHNDYYYADFLDNNGKYYTMMGGSAVPFFDYGISTGYCTISTEESKIMCSLICYSIVDTDNLCQSHRSISYGDYQQYNISQSSSQNVNRTVRIETGCLWMTSRILLEYSFQNHLSTPNLAKLISPEGSSVVSGNNERIYSKSILVMWDIKNSVDHGFSIHAIPNDYFEANDPRNLGIQYQKSNFAVPSPDDMKTKYSIDNSLSINNRISNTVTMELKIVKRFTILHIQADGNCIINGIALNNSIIFTQNLTKSHSSAIIESGEEIFHIVLSTTSITFIKVHVASLILSDTQLSDKCTNGILVTTGKSRTVEISSSSFQSSSNVQIPYYSDFQYCLWFPISTMTKFSIESKTDIGYDTISLYSPETIERSLNPIVVSGIKSISLESDRPLVFLWKTNFSTFHTKVFLKYNQLIYDYGSFRMQNFIKDYGNELQIYTSSNSFSNQNEPYSTSHITFHLFYSGEYEYDIEKYNRVELILPFPDTYICINDEMNYSFDYSVFEINKGIEQNSNYSLNNNRVVLFPSVGRHIILTPNNATKKLSLSCFISSKFDKCKGNMYISLGYDHSILFGEKEKVEDRTVEINSTYETCLWVVSNSTREFRFEKNNNNRDDYFHVYVFSSGSYTRKMFYSNETLNSISAKSFYVVFKQNSTMKDVNATIYSVLSVNSTYSNNIKNFKPNPKSALSKYVAFIIITITTIVFFIFLQFNKEKIHPVEMAESGDEKDQEETNDQIKDLPKSDEINPPL